MLDPLLYHHAGQHRRDIMAIERALSFGILTEHKSFRQQYILPELGSALDGVFLLLPAYESLSSVQMIRTLKRPSQREPHGAGVVRPHSGAFAGDHRRTDSRLSACSSDKLMWYKSLPSSCSSMPSVRNSYNRREDQQDDRASWCIGLTVHKREPGHGVRSFIFPSCCIGLMAEKWALRARLYEF